MKKRVYLILFLLIILLSLFGVFAFNFNSNIFTRSGELKVTSEHPFFVNNSWIVAKDLHVGDLLTNINGNKVRIVGIKDVNVSDGVDVYNLEVKSYSNFVLFNGVVVHNSNKPLEIPEEEFFEFRTPTEDISSVSSPKKEAYFYKTKGDIYEAELIRENNHVERIPLADLPEDVLVDINHAIETKGGYTTIHTHPTGNYAWPSESDLIELLASKDEKSMIIAMTDGASDVQGYLFLRKTDSGEGVIERLNKKYPDGYEELKNSRNLPEGVRESLIFTQFGIINPEKYFQIMDNLGKELGFSYRYVPNKAGGYSFNKGQIKFVKD